MLPLALLVITLGWFDLPPVNVALPTPAVRQLTREELLGRRRDGRAARRQMRRRRVAAGIVTYRVQNRA